MTKSITYSEEIISTIPINIRIKSNIKDNDLTQSLYNFNSFTQYETQTKMLPKSIETLIIGNGPSGIYSSFLLSGYEAYYEPSYLSKEDLNDTKLLKLHEFMKKHPHIHFENIEEIANKFVKFVPPICHDSYSINYNWTSNIDYMLDCLFHPKGELEPDAPSLLKWYLGESIVPHILLGKGRIGGIWSEFEGSTMQAISTTNAIELPGLTFKDWLKRVGKEKEENSRPTRDEVAQYFKDYCRFNYLEDSCFEGVEVTKILPIQEAFNMGLCGCGTLSTETNTFPTRFQTKCNYCINFNYFVKGVYKDLNTDKVMKFGLVTNKIILATGAYHEPKSLKIPGIHLQNVYHRLSDLFKYEENFSLSSSSNSEIKAELQLPILIVGSGLSSADAVLSLTKKQIPIIHLFNSVESYPKPHRLKHPLANCWKSEYPEYHFIKQKMQQSSLPALRDVDIDFYRTAQPYEGFKDSKLIEINRYDKNTLKVTLCDSNNIFYTRFVSNVIILIGYETTLPAFLKMSLSSDSKTNWYKDSNSLITIGSLKGYHFVRNIKCTTWSHLLKVLN